MPSCFGSKLSTFPARVGLNLPLVQTCLRRATTGRWWERRRRGKRVNGRKRDRKDCRDWRGYRDARGCSGGKLRVNDRGLRENNWTRSGWWFWENLSLCGQSWPDRGNDSREGDDSLPLVCLHMALCMHTLLSNSSRVTG